MPPEPRPEVRNLPEVVHGGPDRAELHRLGLNPAAVLDFSVCTNPFGPAPAVREAVSGAALDRYPDRDALALRRALGEVLGVPPCQVLPGNGSSELIWLVALAFLRPRDRVLVLGPTFGEYARAAALMGGEVVTCRAREEDGFALDPAEVGRRLDAVQPRLVFLCNPNNPTGTAFDPGRIAGWARAHRHTLFVVDEAYRAFAPGLGTALDAGADNVLVLRSMTKDHALAGLRLGYAAGPEDVLHALARVRPPWSVNAVAQAAGIAALRDPAHFDRSLEQIAAARASLVASLTALGLAPLPSAVHYFLLRVGDGAAFRLALLRAGVLVRDGASFGLPAYVRIATRRPEENACLLSAIREVTHAG